MAELGLRKDHVDAGTRKANIRLAMVLACVALGFYVLMFFVPT